MDDKNKEKMLFLVDVLFLFLMLSHEKLIFALQVTLSSFCLCWGLEET